VILKMDFQDLLIYKDSAMRVARFIEEHDIEFSKRDTRTPGDLNYEEVTTYTVY